MTPIERELEKKLEKLQSLSTTRSDSEWELYKVFWLASIKDLQNTIIYKWLNDYHEK